MGKGGIFTVNSINYYQIVYQESTSFLLINNSSNSHVKGRTGLLYYVWSIQDHISSLATDPGSTKSSRAGGIKTSKADGSDDSPASSPSVQARGTFQGHENTVEDVQF
ncbi:hypothetical protein AG4045_009258 [Apium graveolens]|uniref:Uncharacterized protein n=1 Tax=Apium graveolens TaxID=4045 RepID=A0A6L5B987_APIGR|nr:hypothetical protein AG4045_020135 [Apium graveolens]KAF1002222.1 hypothetical protein AG4045_009258 [Apium graveolens]